MNEGGEGEEPRNRLMVYVSANRSVSPIRSVSVTWNSHPKASVERLPGRARWLADGVDLEAYRSQLSVGQNVASIEYKGGLAHHALYGIAKRRS